MAGAKRKRFLLIYATQTGQAKAIAEEIAETAPNHGLEAEVHCISLTEKKFWLEREKLVVMISSTTGDGDPPDVAGKFWRRLKKKTLPSDHLAHLKFAFLGLGDTNYSHFCNCGKMMNARLLDLGAKHFYAPAWADDAVGLELAVEPWIEGLWAPLKEEVEHLYDSGENGCDSDASVILNGASNMENNDRRDHLTNGLDLNDKVDGDKITVGHDSDKIEGEKSSTIKLNLERDGKDLELTKKQNSKSEIDNEITRKVPVEISSSQGQDSNKTGTKLATTLDLRTNGVQIKEENPVEPQESDASIEQKNDAKVASLTRSVPPLSESALNLPVLPPAFIKMILHASQSIDLSAVPLQNGCAWPSAKSGVTMATVLSVKQLTSDDAVKRTLTLTLDVSDCDWKYEPGDSFGIVCQNSEEEVQQLISRLKCDDIADQPFSLEIMEGTKKKNPSVPEYIPRNATLRHVLVHCCDIRTVPKKAFLRRLVEHTSDPAEKRRLQELCSRQGSAQYGSYIRDAALSLLDVLTAFPSCSPPTASLIEHLPRLQARPYSASSCLQATPGRLSCVFNVIEIPEGDGRSYGRSGVCTGWIDRLTRGIQVEGKQEKGLTEGMDELTLNEPVKIPIYLRSNQNFRLAEDTTKPIIMIGPGTGVAPFVGFLQKRGWLKTQGAVLGESWLFYGCRHENRDFLFKEELERYRETGVLTHLCVCFSRDEQDSGQPRYVQGNIRANAEALVKLVDEEEAIVYVCGDAKGMAKGVTRAFVEILCQIRGMDTKEAEAYMMQKRLRKTYLENS